MAHADDEAWLERAAAEAHQAIAWLHQQSRTQLEETVATTWGWAPERAVGQESGWFEAVRPQR